VSALKELLEMIQNPLMSRHQISYFIQPNRDEVASELARLLGDGSPAAGGEE
jgi:ribosomal protein S24E